MHNQLQLWLKKRETLFSHRQLLVISGEKNWAVNTALELTSEPLDNNTLWVGDCALDCNVINVKDYQSTLGQEHSRVIFDCFSGFRANAAIALSGTVKANGLMILLCPSLSDWPEFNDPEYVNRSSYGFSDSNVFSFFFKYLSDTIIQDKSVALLTEEQFHSPLTEVGIHQQNKDYNQQQQAILAIKKVANGRRNRPLIITADRGRGKSSALGIAAAELMQEAHIKTAKKIWLTAPHINTTHHVFDHVKRLLPNSEINKNQISFQSSNLIFKPIDIILSEVETADILFIDEAAAIPVDNLIQLTKRFSRIVFSTTIHGYEGSGRGFNIRFKNILAELKPDYKTIKLSEPIRWYQNDPLETFWFKALFYQTVNALPELTKLTTHPYLCKVLSQKELIDSPDTLTSIFRLLVDAHYQTSPDDIQRLLDSPDVKCFVIEQAGVILGIAQIISEGGEKLEALAQGITSCRRRVKGHLVAQNITSTYNQKSFATYEQWRITRIAVLPSLQKRGLGTKLMDYVVQSATSQKVHFITSAFGVNKPLLNFWYKANFTIVKLSSKVEVSSGEHNCICIRPLTQSAINLQTQIKNEFYQDLLYYMDKEWQAIKVDVLINILTNYSIQPNNSEICKLDSIEQFCAGNRSYSTCKRLIREFVIQQINELNVLSLYTQTFVIKLVLQHVPYADIAKEFSLTGKKQIEQELKKSIKKMLVKNL